MRIAGLDAFGLTPGAFARLRDRRVVATLSLATYQVTPAVTRLPPKARNAYLRERVSKWLLLLGRAFPEVRFPPHPAVSSDKRRRRWSGLPTEVVARTTAGRLAALSRSRGVRNVYVSAIEGLRRRARRPSVRSWFCVRARVVV